LRFALHGDVAKYQDDTQERAISVANGRGTVANRSLPAVLGKQQGMIREPCNLAGPKNLFGGIIRWLSRLFIDDVKHLRQGLPLRFGIFPTRKTLGFGIEE